MEQSKLITVIFISTIFRMVQVVGIVWFKSTQFDDFIKLATVEILAKKILNNRAAQKITFIPFSGKISLPYDSRIH